MLPRLTLINFQAHERTVMNFHPGINAIVGGTDQGKSSILRGLRWLRDNRPSGDEFMSHWNWDGDKLVGRTEVTVEIEGGPTVTRARDSKFNGYLVGGDRLAAVRTDVPARVSDAMNMSEVNDQGQLDPPFLLTASPPEVARFFNRVLKLEEVDQLMGWMESRRRKAVGVVETLQARVAENTQKLANLDWVDDAGALMDGLQDWAREAQETERLLEAQVTALDTFRTRQRMWDALLWIGLVEGALQTLRSDLQARQEAQEAVQAQEAAGWRLAVIRHDLQRLEYLSPQLFQQTEQLAAWVNRVGELRATENQQVTALRRWGGISEDLRRLQYLNHPHLDQLPELRDWVLEGEAAWLGVVAQERSLRTWQRLQQQLEGLTWTGPVEAQDPATLKLLVERAAAVEGEAQDKYRILIAYRSRAATILMMADQARDLEAQLPDVCPLCHQPHAKEQH